MSVMYSFLLLVIYLWNYHVSQSSLFGRSEAAVQFTANLLLWEKQLLFTFGNFRGRKLPRISRFCGYLRKFSLQNLGAWHQLMRQKRAICESFLCKIWGQNLHDKSKQSAKVFTMEIVFFTTSRKFSPSKFSRYTVLLLLFFLFWTSTIMNVCWNF